MVDSKDEHYFQYTVKRQKFVAAKFRGLGAEINFVAGNFRGRAIGNIFHTLLISV